MSETWKFSNGVIIKFRGEVHGIKSSNFIEPIERIDEMTTLYDYESLQKENDTLKKHLHNITKILQSSNYDEVTYHLLRIYCQVNSLIENDAYDGLVDEYDIQKLEEELGKEINNG